MKALAAALLCLLQAVSAVARCDSQSHMSRVVAAFTSKSLADVTADLAAIRPPAVSDSDKKRLLKGLPLVTEANAITGLRRDRVAARLRAALELHGRAGVVELIVFRDPRPIVFSKPGVVVALSTEILEIVGDDDAALVGVVAHELAHEYVAMATLHAVASKDDLKQQELELFCDGVAVITLLDLGLDPARYAASLARICKHSEAAAALNDGSSTHPALATRLRLIAEIDARVRSREGPRTGLESTRAVSPRR